MKNKTKLIPADKKQCQVMITDSHGPFRLGPPDKPHQCTSKPYYIVTERFSGSDGQKGKMSMCRNHYDIFLKQGGAGTIRRIGLSK